jgi:hypothetical protein
VTRAQYERALLLTKIDAQRTILGLELRLARATFDPLRVVFSLLGTTHVVAGTVASSVRSLLGRDEGLGAGVLVPLLVAALLPLLGRRRGADDVSPTDESTAESSTSSDQE